MPRRKTNRNANRNENQPRLTDLVLPTQPAKSGTVAKSGATSASGDTNSVAPGTSGSPANAAANATNANPSDELGYTSKQVIKVIGITYRQLDHWDKTGFISPTARQAQGSGSRRLYSYEDLLRFKVAKSLLDSGAVFSSVVDTFEFIEGLGDNILTANIVIDGQRVRYVRSDQEILDVLHQGQGVLSFVGVSQIQEQLNGEIVQLFSGDDADQEQGQTRVAGSGN